MTKASKTIQYIQCVEEEFLKFAGVEYKDLAEEEQRKIPIGKENKDVKGVCRKVVMYPVLAPNADTRLRAVVLTFRTKSLMDAEIVSLSREIEKRLFTLKVFHSIGPTTHHTYSPKVLKEYGVQYTLTFVIKLPEEA
jgi:hypothetical protein